MYTRRAWFHTALAGSATLLFTRQLAGSTSKKPEITVFKRHVSPCCDEWIRHLEQNGFSVLVRPTLDLPRVKADYKIPESLIACHTAVVSGYIVEGHVPADLIHQLPQERKLVAGIAVAGTPADAPGSTRKGLMQDYTVVVFDYEGKISPYVKR
jgi:hypothetical protein